MPIKSDQKARYPADWKQIRKRIIERAGNRCEGCGAPNYWLRHSDGTISPLGPQDGSLVSRIVLTIAHLDHTPENCSLENLRAWCQRCHLAYDLEHHQRNARATRRGRKAIGDLFP